MGYKSKAFINPEEVKDGVAQEPEGATETRRLTWHK
jgi:hypothetical protein